jgi:shikimate kinase
MGSGKTTVGRLLAARLGRPFLDSDQEIEARTGRTVRDVFAADGEPAFRALEAEVLAEALASDPPAVVAAAGGTVLAAENRRRMDASGTVVWLRAEPDVLVARAATGTHRPLLDDDPAGVLATMATDRERLYREVADVEVEVGGRDPDAVADEILAALA